jgi:PBP1b-binding outer membrane lipoprotein LpoB
MKQKSLFVIVIAALLLAACGGKSAEVPQVSEPVQVEQAPVVAEEPAAAVEEPAMVEEPAAEEPASSSGMMTYSAPENLFTLDIPAGWTQEKDSSSIEKSDIETYTAPDGHAFVQVLVNKTNVDISAVEKGQITLDFMRRLYGDDLQVAKDVSLADGREQLDWWSDQNKTTGTTYFDTQDSYLYFTSMVYEDAYEDSYKTILTDVADSFSY